MIIEPVGMIVGMALLATVLYFAWMDLKHG